MKLKIKMTRKPGCPWGGTLGGRSVTACSFDVSALFHMGRGKKATFELSNVQPRGHEDYHVFKWYGSCYRAIEITHGYVPCITSRVSSIIRQSFQAKKQKADRIYASII